MRLIKPPEYGDIPPSTPLVTLLGPRRCEDWQTLTERWFLGSLRNIRVVSTRSKEWSPDLSEVAREMLKRAQESWLTFHLKITLKRMLNREVGEAPAIACIWFAKEKNPDSTRNYAGTSLFAAGNLVGWMSGASGREIFQEPDAGEFPDGLFIGAEDGFCRKGELENSLRLSHRLLYSSRDEMQEVALKYLLKEMEKAIEKDEKTLRLREVMNQV